MSRIDWHEGRFRTDQYEVAEAHEAIRGYQNTQVYDEILYFRFSHRLSTVDPLFDEAAEGGKVFRPPVVIPTLHVNHNEGERRDGPNGFYFVDSIYITASFDQLFRHGLVFEDIRTNKYLKDRLVYDTRVFNVTNVQIEGQVRQRDMIVGIEGVQAKPDELINDPQFAGYVKESIYSDGDLL